MGELKAFITTSLNEKIEPLHEKLDEIPLDFKKQLTEVILDSNAINVETDIRLSGEVEDLQAATNNSLEACKRRRNLIIRGLSKQDKENLSNTFLNIGEKLEVQVTPDDLDDLFRLPSRATADEGRKLMKLLMKQLLV